MVEEFRRKRSVNEWNGEINKVQIEVVGESREWDIQQMYIYSIFIVDNGMVQGVLRKGTQWGVKSERGVVCLLCTFPSSESSYEDHFE